MSTILDALRKSEQERKLNKLPTLTDMQAPKEPSRWPMYIGLALVLVAIALVVLAYVIWSAKPTAAVLSNDGAEILALQGESSQTVDLLTTDSSTLAEGSISSEDSMLVNVISYSEDPALSFAMVGGKMVREGEFIEPGLKVDKILFDAVIFNARGKKVTRRP